jgi:hypothetical protein
LVAKLLGGELEARCRPERQVDDDQPANCHGAPCKCRDRQTNTNLHVSGLLCLVHHHKVREAVFGSIPADLLQVVFACAKPYATFGMT